MPRPLLQWWCVLLALFAGASAPLVSAATFLVVPKQVSLKFYFSPTNLTINVGDTVLWTNLGTGIHSLEASPTNAPEQFCGTGTNFISNCSVTFFTPGVFHFDCAQHLPSMTGSVTVLGPFALITNPPNNTIFAAPASVTVGADVTDVGGTVTNVQFLNNGISIATNTAAPYRVTLSNLAVGNYTLRARALDTSSLVATSPPITLRVAPPPSLVATRGTDGPLQFSFNTATNVSYVVEAGLTVTNFSPIVTNAGTGGTQQFSQSNPPPAQRFFRVRLQ